MRKKYELTDDSIQVEGKTLYRIKALVSFNDVTAGDLGGFIEKEDNLSHEGNAWVYDNARVFDNASVLGNAKVYDNARISGNASVYGNARICDDTIVSGNARVYGNAHVCDDAIVSGNATVYRNAIIKSIDDYVCISGFGSENRHTTFYRDIYNNISVKCGCFNGTIDEFIEKVKETHGNTKYAREYLAAVDLVKIHFNM